MISFSSKPFQRLRTVASHALVQLLPSLLNLALSWVLIRGYDAAWWGTIVELQLVQYAAVTIAAWGSKEYLLRAFSSTPAHVKGLWKNALLSRLPVWLCLLPLLLLLPYPLLVLFHLVVWITCRFFQQAFDPLLIYEKRFTPAMVIETLNLLALNGFLLWSAPALSFNGILWAISASAVCRVLLMAAWYGRHIPGAHTEQQTGFTLLKQSLPFMLLSLAGLLQAKSDLACVIFYLDKEQVAAYQVLMSFMLLFQVLPSLVFTPYLKNIYRVNDRIIHALQSKSMLAGSIVCAAGIPAVYMILELIYQLHFEWMTYVFSAAYMLSTFFYFLYIYVLYRHEQQVLVMWVSMGSVLVNIIACLFLIPVLGIPGAMLANCISQACMWVVYRRTGMNKLKQTVKPA